MKKLRRDNGSMLSAGCYTWAHGSPGCEISPIGGWRMVESAGLALADHLREVAAHTVAQLGVDAAPNVGPLGLAGRLTDDLLTAGGKQIRARLSAMSFLGLSHNFDAGRHCLLKLGTAIELFHAFALVHDDIIDDSELRRGRPTIHAAAERAHMQGGLYGDTEAFGMSVALLAGDRLLTTAWGLMVDAAVETPELLVLWRGMCRDVVDGETSELIAAAMNDVQYDSAINIVDFKTGLYTVSCPLRMGAALAGYGADVSLNNSLISAGIKVGRGFQIQDDLLNVYGDAEARGKPCGTDVESGKPTVFRARCVAALVRQGHSSEYAVKDFSSSSARAAELGLSLGVAQELRHEVEAYFRSGSVILQSLPFSPTVHRLFADLLDRLRNRRG